MWAPLLLLLVGWSQASSLERPDRDVLGYNTNLQPSSGYLPPPQAPACQPSVVYRTQVQYSTLVVPSTVYNNQVQYLTKSSYRTQQVYTTVYSEVVRTEYVPQIRYQTQFVTQTQENIRTQVVNLPPMVNYVTQTKQAVRTQVSYETKYESKVQYLPSTVIRNVVSTLVIPQEVVETIYQTLFVTRTQHLPGQTHTVQNVRYSTVYSTVVQPGRNVYITETVVRTNVFTQTIRQSDQTQFVTSTQVVPVTSTIYSQVILTNTQTKYATRTQFEQRVATVVRTKQVPQYNTRIVTVPQQVIRTQVSTRVVPTTIVRQQIVPSVINLPAYTQFKTVVRTSVRTQYLPGQTRTVFQTRTVYNTNYVTSTIYKKQINTVYATRTVQPNCGSGYNYDAPAISFNALG